MTLDRLGFSAASERDAIRVLAGAPSGMLLVTGPTGTGKTTTLYAVLSEINSGLEKIITIEDPVEYELPGVLQIPVNERKGLTFATGLRSILRHDPDRILVGEIRDAETAEIAVQSALTGHLVFTTVHANSVADVVGRFRHFDIDMFGFMAALNGVVVQRLVRRLCPPHCAQRRELTAAEAAWLATAARCKAAQRAMCRRRWVAPSAGTPATRVASSLPKYTISTMSCATTSPQEPPLSTLKTHAAKQGVVSLLAQSAAHVVAGHTTIEEIRRVVGGVLT